MYCCMNHNPDSSSWKTRINLEVKRATRRWLEFITAVSNPHETLICSNKQNLTIDYTKKGSQLLQRGGYMKKNVLLLLCLLMLSALYGCSSMGSLINYFIIPESVTIEGVTYRSGFYGDLYPAIGDMGSKTIQDDIIYDDGRRQFRRVNFDGHDWVHCYAGEYMGGVVYCAESQWQQTRDYYTDSSNFEYYFGIGHSIAETAVSIPEIDPQKFDELLDFASKNVYNPFAGCSNENIMQKVRRIPESEFHGGLCFTAVSADLSWGGFF